MRIATIWIPLLSASLVCATARNNASSAAESQVPLPSAHDGGSPPSAVSDAGVPVLNPGDAGLSLSFPASDDMQAGDLHLDGPAFKAIRVAVEDFKPRHRKPPSDKVQACLDDEAAYDFQVQRRGDLFFIRVTTLSERCDPIGVYTDGGIRYVISADGRILRKLHEGQR